MKIIYEAEDGKRFEHEDDCEMYEKRLHWKQKSVLQNDTKCFDDRLNPIPMEDILDETTAPYFIWFKNDEAITAFRREVYDCNLSEFYKADFERGFNVYVDQMPYNKPYECWTSVGILESYVTKCYELQEREGL